MSIAFCRFHRCPIPLGLPIHRSRYSGLSGAVGSFFASGADKTFNKSELINTLDDSQSLFLLVVKLNIAIINSLKEWVEIDSGSRVLLDFVGSSGGGRFLDVRRSGVRIASVHR